MLCYAQCMLKDVTLGPITSVRFSAELRPSEDVPARAPRATSPHPRACGRHH